MDTFEDKGVPNGKKKIAQGYGILWCIFGK
jgi:hypothetical protein